VIEASHRHDFERARAACDRLAKLDAEHGESWMLSYGHLNLGIGLLMADRGDLEAGQRLHSVSDACSTTGLESRTRSWALPAMRPRLTGRS
jgi:hypothetical protein